MAEYSVMWAAGPSEILVKLAASVRFRNCWLDTSIYETSQSLNLRRSDALNPHSKKTRDNGKRGTRWEIRARRIRKKVRNRTPKNNIRRTKRRRTSNRKEPLDTLHQKGREILILVIMACYAFPTLDINPIMVIFSK